MNYFFTADAHLGHENIIKYCNRPFKNIKEMDSTIIKNWNARVDREDVVYHIGDFCFRYSTEAQTSTKDAFNHYREQLNGHIIFIKGNHDNNNACKTNIVRLVIMHGGQLINLVHDPHYVDVNYNINLTGHVHEKWEIQRIKKNNGFTDAINVGVDVWNFYPITINEILSRYSRRSKNENNL